MDDGKRPGFLAGLEEPHLRFLGEVPRNFSCRAAHRSGRGPSRYLPRSRWP